MINIVRGILLVIAMGVISLAGFFFYKVKDMHFDIPKLKRGLEEVLKIKNYAVSYTHLTLPTNREV